jgi:tetratricopeptide (TPR) repeat protein
MTDHVLHIPGYSLHRQLGAGGMADVYLATQESLRRKVAIKVLHTDDQGFSERFIKEAHILASLQHPAIITIHDIGTLADGRSYLAMEYVGGGDLARFRGQVFEPAQAFAIIQQIASGLAVVHRHGLIHRDVKPANILFREDGSALLTDFGVAQEVEQDCDFSQSGIAVGSPSYISPEQAQCLPVDARSDIYSLGVVLLEMLTGQNPFRGANHTESLLNHVEKAIPPLSGPLALYQGLLERMLAKDPDERFADCETLLQTLDQLASDDSDLTQFTPTLVPSRTPQSTRASAWRPWRWVGGALLAAVLGFGLVVGGFYLKTQMQIRELLALAEQRLVEGRILLPEQDSADHYFREVIKLDAHNSQASLGLDRVLQARIEGYLQQAEARMATDQLLQPAEDSALFYFRQVLGWAPDNALAQQGVQRVVQRLVEASEQAYARNDFPQALSVLEQGLDALPDQPELLQRRVAHENRVLAFEAARRAAAAKAKARRQEAQLSGNAMKPNTGASVPSKGSAANQAEEPRNPIKRLWKRLFN